MLNNLDSPPLSEIVDEENYQRKKLSVEKDNAINKNPKNKFP